MRGDSPNRRPIHVSSALRSVRRPGEGRPPRELTKSSDEIVRAAARHSLPGAYEIVTTAAGKAALGD
jgi:hypothetical protein